MKHYTNGYCLWEAEATARLAGARLGFTLIELLAVIVILSLTLGVGITSLATIDNAARFQRARTSILDLDARARLIARRGTPVEIDIQRADGTWTARVRRIETGETLASFAEHGSIEAELITLAQPQDGVRVPFDARGRCPDYSVRLQHRDHAEEWAINGLTGWVREDWGAGR
ncbi:MAG: prepilin-type N-terminal cleavage/methylation domain-containing protein [Acidimicrobiia bacterium]|nr:prepilin-type N-terminal cleavage/methylation domain-containing protein [Acidimicrobiia bacterium]